MSDYQKNLETARLKDEIELLNKKIELFDSFMNSLVNLDSIKKENEKLKRENEILRRTNHRLLNPQVIYPYRNYNYDNLDMNDLS